MEEYYNMSADKTNVMRILDQKKIKYKVHEYKDSGAVSGVEVAATFAGCSCQFPYNQQLPQ